MHIIFCVRAREKVKMETVDGKAVFTPLGFQPVQEKNFMFEMTGSLMLHDQGRRQEILKCPADLLPILGQGKGFLGIEHGEKLRAWIDGGEAIDPKLAKVKAELATACEQGTEAFKTAWTAAWKSLDATQRELIHADLETYKASAAGYDEHKRKLSEDETAVDQVAAKLAVNGGTNAGNSTATSHERID
jgi:hypothetical protein